MKKKITFKEVLENKKVDNDSVKYVCNYCKKVKSDKPWLIYYHDENRCNMNICSYICNNKERKLYPKLWVNLVNKEDFNHPIPIVNTSKKKFEILSNIEIFNLSNKDKDDYYTNLNKFYNDDPDRALLLMNIQNNMDYIDMMDNTLNSSDSDINDDDY